MQLQAHQSAATGGKWVHAPLLADSRGDRRISSRSSRVRVSCGFPNTFGTLYRVTTFGESHGRGVGCVIDGCPPRLPISEEEIQIELNR